MRVCARARVRACLGDDQGKNQNKCENGKGKEVERRLLASVMNSCIVVWVSMATGHPP